MARTNDGYSIDTHREADAQATLSRIATLLPARDQQRLDRRDTRDLVYRSLVGVI